MEQAITSNAVKKTHTF